MDMEQWCNRTDRGKLKYWEWNLMWRWWKLNKLEWRNGGMVLTEGYWSTGRETCSVDGRWMNWCGAMMEWYWQREPEEVREKQYVALVVSEWMCRAMVKWYWQWETKVLGKKYNVAWLVGEWMRMDKWRNGTHRWNLNYCESYIISRGCRWINGCGTMVERYWQGKLIEKYYVICVVGEWVWSNGWSILTLRNWSTGREKLCSMGGRWMFGCAAMVEW